MQKTLLALGAIALFATSMMMFHKGETGVSSAQSGLFTDFKLWAAKYGKIYDNATEEAYRFGVWMKALKFISENQGDSYTLGMNSFADLETDEFKAMYLMPKGVVESFHTEETAFKADSLVGVPTSVDWVSQGKTIEVLNQGQCGSCWAFSTVESIDSAYAVTLNVPVPDLSEQQVVSCSILYGEFGCNGGNVVPAYKYVLAHPLATESQYPYVSGNTQRTGVCDLQKQNLGTNKISGYKTIAANDCTSLQAAIAITPVSVCVDASTWQYYQSGIFTNCGNQLDHCVLATGYVQDSYWMIQNSWTTSWGESGFIQLGWGNTCGVCQEAQYPTVA